MALSCDLEFTLHAQAVDVPVQLRRVGDRWTAHTEFGGRVCVGLGASPRAALEASLQPLGPGAASTCLADLDLLRPSIELIALKRSSAG